MTDSLKTRALEYHSSGRPGKIEVIPSKPYKTQADLSLAYSPGVAEPCLEIEKNPEDAYKYTAKGNLVAVISNGTATLGLGNIGAQACKPVMEGKGLLFKIFADIDVFDIEVDLTDIDAFINTVKAIAPTFGGINLEDIKAPECFEIEERLKQELSIPVMHDDQHGTAIISAAGLLNALEIIGKKIEDIKVVVNGAGAAAVSCSKLYESIGVRHDNILMVDTKGVLNIHRKDLTGTKLYFAANTTKSTLADAMKGADVFLGLSVANVVSQEMVQSMNDNPIVFAMANPNPEISYVEAIASRKDIIFATGRSDHPNQINNVLGFPYIFRGAMDVSATAINEAMKVAAVKAIAELAKLPVPESVNKAYNISNLSFGPQYIIPKPLDPRLITVVSPAVAKAAIDSGVAKKIITDWDAYKKQLAKRLGRDNELVDTIKAKAIKAPKRVVFAEADDYKVLKAAMIATSEGIAMPILLGDAKKIESIKQENKLDLDGLTIIDMNSEKELNRRKKYAELLLTRHKCKGLTSEEAFNKAGNTNYVGALMVEAGDADAFVSGSSKSFNEIAKIGENTVGIINNTKAGLNIITTKKGTFFLADTQALNHQPDGETMAEIAILAANKAKDFGFEPVVALLTHANSEKFECASIERIEDAMKILKVKAPNLLVEGGIEAQYAINKSLRKEFLPNSILGNKDVNVLVFPNASSGNIVYNLLQSLESNTEIGPLLLGCNKPIFAQTKETTIDDLVALTAIAVVECQKIIN